MPSYKKELKKIRKKKIKGKVGENLLTIGKTTGQMGSKLLSNTFNLVQTNLVRDVNIYTQISGTIDQIIKKLSMNTSSSYENRRDQLHSFLKDCISINNELLKTIFSLGNNLGIIINRLDECYNSSISSKPKKIELFLKKII